MEKWIGVDLDGTLAYYDGWVDELHIGQPIPKMVNRVREWIDEGRKVKIFTARVSTGNGDRATTTVDDIREAIQNWAETYIGYRLEVTCTKDYGMIELWDDRAVQVIRNEGTAIVTI